MRNGTDMSKWQWGNEHFAVHRHPLFDRIPLLGNFASVRFVSVLPKTRSGKVLRRAIQAVCEGRDAGDLTTMEDPAALAQIKDLVS